MENKKEEAKGAIDKVKAILSGYFTKESEAPIKAAFVSATLETGEAVEIEPALEVGAAVVVISAEGEVKAAPDAMHTLVSGEVITTVEGIITEIVPVEEEIEEPVEEEVEMEAPAEESVEQKVKKVVESTIKESHFTKEEVDANIAAKVTEVMELFNKTLDERMAKQEDQLHVVIMSCFEQFAKEPIKEPTKKAKFSVREKKNNIFTGK